MRVFMARSMLKRGVGYLERSAAFLVVSRPAWGVAALLFVVGCGAPKVLVSPETQQAAHLENEQPGKNRDTVSLEELHQSDAATMPPLLSAFQRQLREAHGLLGSPVHPLYSALGQQRTKKAEAEESYENFSSCIVGDAPTIAGLDKHLLQGAQYNPSGQSGSLSFKILKSKHALRKALNLNAYASTSLLFSTLTTQAHAEYFKEAIFSEDHAYMAYTMEVHHPQIRMSRVRLSPEAYQLFQKRGFDAFYRRCGREAVVGFQAGGQIFAVAKMYLSESSKHQSLGAALKAQGIADLDAEVGLKKMSDMVQSDLEVDFYVRFVGGEPQNIPTTVAELKEIATKWGKSVGERSVITQLITQPYGEIIANIDPHYDVIRESIRHFMAQLDRLGNIKDIMLKRPFYRRVHTHLLPPEEYERLDQLMQRVSQQLDICRASSKVKDCNATKLLVEAQQFSPRITAEHPRCGPLMRSVEKPHRSCGSQQVVEQRLIEDPRCGIRKRTPVLVDSQTVIRKKTYEGERVTFEEHHRAYAKSYAFKISDYSSACRRPGVRRKSAYLSSEVASKHCQMPRSRFNQGIVKGNIRSNPSALYGVLRGLGFMTLNAEFFPQCRWDVVARYRLSCTRDDPVYSSCDIYKAADKRCQIEVPVADRYRSCRVSVDELSRYLEEKTK